MPKRRVRLTETQINELTWAYAHSKDGLVRTRLQAIRLYGTGYPVEEILDITGCSRTSLMEWYRKYRDSNLAGLMDHRLGGNHSKLTPAQRQEVQARLEQYTPRALFGPHTATADGQYWTVEDLTRALEQWYSLTYKSHSSYYELLLACGFSYQQTERVFKSRREFQVVEFEEQVEKN